MPKNKKNRKRQSARNKSTKNVKKPMKIQKKCNWDNLPNELKLMCIGETDIKTRANLMLSNRHNKMLVESIKSKHHLRFVYFEAEDWFRTRSYDNLTFAVKSWRSKADYTSNKYEPRKLIDVLSNANIDELKFYFTEFSKLTKTGEHFTNVLATCNKKFSVKSIHLIATHRIGLDVLQRCDEQLEQISVTFDNASNSYDMRTLLGIPQAIAAKRLNIFFPWRYAQARLRTVINWLLDEVDHDISKKIIFQIEVPSWQNSWQFFVEVTETDRDFHHPTENIICFRPSNPSKRVWAWQSKENKSINFLVVAEGSDAPNFEEIEKKRDKEIKEHELRTKL